VTDIMTLASPPDWQLYQLGQLFRERKEKGSDKDFPPLSVTMGGIVPQLETAAKTDDGDNRKVVRVGDYVINSRSDRKGSGGISEHEGSVSLISIVLQPRDSIEPRFAHHLLRSPAFQEEFYRWGHGIVADLWTTRYGDMKNIRLRVPDLATQRQIADFLDRETARIDLLIEKKQRLVALLGEKARSVINQATTVGFRECETLDSGEKWLGEVATHWRITPLKWFTRLQSGYAFKADRFGDIGTRLVRMNNLKRGTLDLEEAVCIADEDVNMSVVLRSGDILLGMSGSIGETGSLGNFAVVAEDNLPCLLNQRVGRFQFVGEDLIPDYLKLVIQSASFLDPIFLAATSTAQFNVSPSQVGAIMFALPPVSEQNEIVSEVARRNIGLNEARDRTLTSIDRLKEYRSALITAAVTGQIDVTTYAKSGTPDRRLDAIQEEMGAWQS
jgi:type I restriction enzyme, S subunit